MLTSKLNNEQNEINLLKKYIETLKFTIHIIIQNKIFNIIDIVSKSYQNINKDIKKRVNYLKIEKKSAITIVEKWDIKISFSKKMNRNLNMFLWTLYWSPINRSRNNFKINVFYDNLDIIILQLCTYFMGTNNIVNKFKSIFFKNAVQYSNTELAHFAKIVFEKYSNNLSIICKSILSFRRVLFQYVK